jgi:methyl-accepting chemotaxis protein
MKALIQTVKFKIYAAMGASLLLMACISVFGVTAISRLKTTVNDSFSEVTMPIVDLTAVQAAQLDIRLHMRRIQTFHEQAQTEKSLVAIRDNLANMDKAWADYYPAHVSDQQERMLADRINDALPQFRLLTGQVVTLLAAGNYDGAAQPINDHASFSDTVLVELAKDVQRNISEGREFSDRSADTASTALITAVVLMLVGLAVVAGASVLVVRAIARPLKQAIGVANDIAAGQLDNVIATDGGGEFGDLLRALAKMDRQISSTVRGIQSSAESVTVASREIASGNLDLSARTEQQASSLAETAASMTQLTETVRQNADNAREANALAANANALAEGGDTAVRAMVGTIAQISGSSSKISEISGVIEGIAFQTNILALNAAVEAARAGEQGRGFAVVAGEVRNLAQRSASAAKEIKELITSSVSMIEGGSKQATGVGETINQVKQAIKRVSDIVGEITTASEEQSRGIEQVNQAVSQMDEVTQQNAALVEEAAAAAQSLEQQAVSLKEATAVFKLQDQAKQTLAPIRSTTSVRVTVAQKKGGLRSLTRTAPLLASQSRSQAKSPHSVQNSTVSDWENF